MSALEDACDIQVRANIAASFQRVALEHLEDRVFRAAAWALEDWPGIRHLVVAGGVAANQLLRSKLQVGETVSMSTGNLQSKPTTPVIPYFPYMHKALSSPSTVI